MFLIVSGESPFIFIYLFIYLLFFQQDIVDVSLQLSVDYLRKQL